MLIVSCYGNPTALVILTYFELKEKVQKLAITRESAVTQTLCSVAVDNLL